MAESVIGWISALLSNDIIKSLVIAGLLAGASWIFTRRGVLYWSVTHAHMFVVPAQPPNSAIPLRTQHISVWNGGRKALERIEVILNHKPLHYEVWRPQQITETSLRDGRLSIQTALLRPKEGFTISIVETVSELPPVVSVTSAEGHGKLLVMYPQRLFPKWVRFLIGVVMLAGTFAIIYVGVRLGVAMAN